jgi:hypothetical protein
MIKVNNTAMMLNQVKSVKRNPQNISNNPTSKAKILTPTILTSYLTTAPIPTRSTMIPTTLLRQIPILRRTPLSLFLTKRHDTISRTITN